MTHISRVHAVKAVLSRLAIAAVLFAAPLFAQENTRPQAAPEQPDISALMQKIRDLEDRIIAMEGEIRQLKDQQAAAQSVLRKARQRPSRSVQAAAAPTPSRALHPQAQPPSSQSLWAAPEAVRPKR